MKVYLVIRFEITPILFLKKKKTKSISQSSKWIWL